MSEPETTLPIDFRVEGGLAAGEGRVTLRLLNTSDAAWTLRVHAFRLG